MADPSFAQVAQQITALVAYWKTRDEQFQSWLGGSATGGPFMDGRFPLTDYTNRVYYVKSPAALQASVDTLTAAADGALQQARSAATRSEQARDGAVVARGGAEAARDAAGGFRDEALAARDVATNAAAQVAPENFYSRADADAVFRRLDVPFSDGDIDSFSYDKLIGTPAVFPPAPHVHPASQIVGYVPGSVVPLLVPPGTRNEIPANSQALARKRITNKGVLSVKGRLIFI